MDFHLDSLLIAANSTVSTVTSIQPNDWSSEKWGEISPKEKKDWGEPEKLSLDELSRQKGKRKFVTVVFFLTH